jgi:2,4-diketo-3-deoxy-L-fuconate hydrolase
VRIANYRGRLALVVNDKAIDVATASEGRFDPAPALAFNCWAELTEWAATVDVEGDHLDERELGPPSPLPRQVFGIGLNYASHAAEGGVAIPESPLTFTKFPSCIAGQHATVRLPSGSVDWEVELVVVIGRDAHHVDVSEAWSYVAGVMVGQDISEREVQVPPGPQLCLAKSFAQFGPTGPWIVTHDELADRDDLAIGCTLNGETMQSSRTSNLIFNVPTLISFMSSIVTLFPGDLIFTGTPDGVGATRTPKHYIAAGDELVSSIEGVGTLYTHFTS